MIEISRLADDNKTGMTIGEIRQFLSEVSRAGLSDDLPVQAVVGFKTQLQKLRTRG